MTQALEQEDCSKKTQPVESRQCQSTAPTHCPFPQPGDPSFLPGAAARPSHHSHGACCALPAPAQRLRFTPSKQTSMCFIFSSILPSEMLKNCTALPTSTHTHKKKNPKQVGTFGFFQLSRPPSANSACISTRFKARSFHLQPSIKTV